MDDDFNTPQAIGALNQLATTLAEERKRVQAGERSGQRLREGRGRPDRPGPGAGPVDEGTRVRDRAQVFEPERRAHIDALVEERDEARQRRDWAQADALRAELDALGVAVEDTPAGPKWKLKRRATGALILAGRHPVLEALRSRARPIEEVLVEAEARDRHADILALARQAGVRLSRVPRAALTSLAGTTHHQGVVARAAPREYAELEDLLAVPADPGGAGAVSGPGPGPGPRERREPAPDRGGPGGPRGAGAAAPGGGADAPRGPGGGGRPRVPAGGPGGEPGPGARASEAGGVLDRRSRGRGRGSRAAQAPWTADLRGALVLVLGSEGRGLRPLVARTCDLLVRIPLAGRVGSLNVAAAGAALLYEVRRQRREAWAPGQAAAGKNWVDTWGSGT